MRFRILLLLTTTVSLAVNWGPAESARAAGRVPIGPAVIARPAPDGPESRAVLGPPASPLALRPPDARLDLYPSYAWPLERANGDGIFCANYVDDDPTAGVRDFMNGDWTYDSHRGTDISLFDFKAMDRGYRIVAAAAGTVSSAAWSNARDRNCDQPDNPTLNYVEMANGDGTYTYYFHLRANSMTVNVGEAVAAGQMLGMAGSSGYSFGPHLHFEAADWLGGPYVARDPWGGPGHPEPGLWIDQEPYAGTQDFQALDFGVVTQAGAGGDIFNVDYCEVVAERFHEPAVFGLDEPWFAVWLYPLGREGDDYRIEVRMPNGELWGDVDYTLPFDLRGGYQYWIWQFSPWATQTGTWVARIFHGATLLKEHAFQVAATSQYGPRLVRGGRSFRINGTVQKDTLRVRPLGGSGPGYAAVALPAPVSLVDSVVTIGATSTQPYRSREFQVVVTNTAGRRDTAWYHLVDPTKPPNPTVSVEREHGTSGLALAVERSNPFTLSTSLRFLLPRAGRVALTLHDVTGRRIRTLLDEAIANAGVRSVGWNGADDSGAQAAAGVYFARLSLDAESVITRLVRLR